VRAIGRGDTGGRRSACPGSRGWESWDCSVWGGEGSRGSHRCLQVPAGRGPGSSRWCPERWLLNLWRRLEAVWTRSRATGSGWSCLSRRGWTRWTPEVPASLGHSVVNQCVCVHTYGGCVVVTKKKLPRLFQCLFVLFCWLYPSGCESTYKED